MFHNNLQHWYYEGCGFIKRVMRVLQRLILLSCAIPIALFLRYFIPARFRQMWLIGGFANMAYGDNSAAFHQFIRTNHKEIEIYWVIHPQSPDLAKAQAVGPVLYSNQIRTYIYSLLADVRIISHGLSDVPGCDSRFSKKGSINVRLGHGLTAMKKTILPPFKKTGYFNKTFDLVAVSSTFEKEIKLTWGFSPEKIVITGLPRWDTLHRKYSAIKHNIENQRRILYAPTSRPWLKTRQEIEVFFEKVSSFLNSAMEEFLTDHNLFLDVRFHILFGDLPLKFFSARRFKHIHLLDNKSDFQENIIQAMLLITDYSSVAWDFLYLDKPVFFFQFDREEWECKRGSYIDLSQPLFGPNFSNITEVMRLLRSSVKDAFVIPEYKELSRQWRNRAFAYVDDNNCARVYNEIIRKLHREID